MTKKLSQVLESVRTETVDSVKNNYEKLLADVLTGTVVDQVLVAHFVNEVYIDFELIAYKAIDHYKRNSLKNWHDFNVSKNVVGLEAINNSYNDASTNIILDFISNYSYLEDCDDEQEADEEASFLSLVKFDLSKKMIDQLIKNLNTFLKRMKSMDLIMTSKRQWTSGTEKSP